MPEFYNSSLVFFIPDSFILASFFFSYNKQGSGLQVLKKQVYNADLCVTTQKSVPLGSVGFTPRKMYLGLQYKVLVAQQCMGHINSPILT